MSFGSSINSALADPATCEQKLDACRNAVNEQEKDIALRKFGIQLRDDELVRLQKENSEIRTADTSVLHNPFFWAAVGVIVGAYAGARATR